jgi:hypothetical protein
MMVDKVTAVTSKCGGIERSKEALDLLTQLGVK